MSLAAAILMTLAAALMTIAQAKEHDFSGAGLPASLVAWLAAVVQWTQVLRA
jgi:hypothetical protein